MKKKDFYIHVVFFIFLFFSLIFIAFKFCDISFDGAMNFQVSKNLVEKHEYSTNYVDIGYNSNDSLLFDHKIQTGSPVILPTAILNAIFGTTLLNYQFVLVLFYMLFLGEIFFIIKRYANTVVSILCVLFFVPFTYENPFFGYGEIAMGAVMLASLILFHISRDKHLVYSFITGVLLGTGYLTKTVFLICVPSFFLFFVFELFTRTDKKNVIQRWFLMILGAVSIVFLFELYKFISLGSAKNYINWWKQEISCIKTESGTRDRVHSLVALFNRAKNNLIWYAREFKSIVALELFIILFPIFWYTYCLKQKQSVSLFSIQIYIIFLTYMAWWLFIVPDTRLSNRRILMGFVFSILNFLIIFFSFIRVLNKEKSIHSFVWGGVMTSIILISFIPKTTSSISSLVNSRKNKSEMFSMVRFIKTLPDNARFFGRAWWQNPCVAGYADVTMHNLDCENLSGVNDYFVEDLYMKCIASETLENVKMDYYLTPVFSNGYGSIWQILGTRDEVIEKQGRYIRIDAGMPYWGNIVLDYGNGIKDSSNMTIMHGHILFELPEKAIKSLTITFNNYDGYTTDIHGIHLVDGDETFDLLSEDTNFSVKIVNLKGGGVIINAIVENEEKKTNAI